MNPLAEIGQGVLIWTTRYEDLRDDWMKGRVGWGQALFVRKGMATWIRAWPNDPPNCEVRDSPEGGCGVLEIDGSLKQELTIRMVSMILDRTQEAAA